MIYQKKIIQISLIASLAVVASFLFLPLIQAQAAAANAVDNYVWVVNHVDNTVSQIDKTTDTVVKTIPVGSGPGGGVAVDPEYVWVSNNNGYSVSKIDKLNSAVVSTISLGTEGGRPSGLAVDTNYLWVSISGNPGKILKIDKSTNITVKTISVGWDPYGVAVDNDFVWVIITGSDTVLKIDKSNDTVVKTISVGSGALYIAVDNNYVWTTNRSGNTVSKIDKSTNTVVSTIPVGSYPIGIVVDNNYVWVTNYRSNTVSKIDKSTNTVVSTISIGSYPIGIAVDNNYVWVTSIDDSVSKIDKLTNTVVKKIPVGSYPLMGGDGTGYAYDMFFFTAPADNDGIEDKIDTAPLVFSDSFSDVPLGGTTYGTISTRGGWNVSITELAQPQGVLATITGSGTSPARIVSCNNNIETTLEAAGESVIITCGSTTVLAKTTVNTIELRSPQTGVFGKAVKVKLSAGQAATIGSPITAGSQNTEPIIVEVLDEQDQVIGSGSLKPAEKLDIEFVGDTVVLTTLSANPISFTLDGQILTLAPNQPVTDACPGAAGPMERQGCPFGDANTVMLHIVDQAKTNACPAGAGSCKSPIANAPIKIFDRNNSAFKVLWGSNPPGYKYAEIYEGDAGRISSCTTNNLGKCIAGESYTGDFLVIVKYYDSQTGRTVYTGLPKDSTDFVNGLATKDFQILKTIKKDGSIQWSGGSKIVVTGSMLEIVYPDGVIWETTSFVYPFIFTSDADWTTDVCAQVPKGYNIVGVYDEFGNLVRTDKANCVQTFVKGETKVIAYDVLETSSPEPNFKANFKVRSGKGPIKALTLDVKGIRMATLKAEKAKGMPFTGIVTILDGLANLAIGVALVIVLGIPTLIVMSVRGKRKKS